MKTLVFTSATADMSLMLAEWAVSLRRLAGYAGDALVLDYGLSPPVRSALAHWGVRTVDCDVRGSVVCTRYVDVIPHLAAEYAAHVVAHFDADVWFQRPVDDLFAAAAALRPGGCLFAPDVGWYTQPPHGDPAWAAAYAAKVGRIRAALGGTVQGGVSCGRAPDLARRYGRFADLLAGSRLPLRYGADQFAFNWLFDEDADSGGAHLWNVIGSDATLVDGVWYSNRGGGVLRPAIGVHVVGMLRGERRRLFRNLHADLFARELDAAGLGTSRSDTVTLPRWEPPAGDRNDDRVWGALASVITTCRRHRGAALAVGTPVPRAAFADVGCLATVPLGHGHDHYWDRLGLPRRPHIARPASLYLSPEAVRRLADTPLDRAWNLPARFERGWFDFMLTMMCAERGLSWGPVWTPEPGDDDDDDEGGVGGGHGTNLDRRAEP